MKIKVRFFAILRDKAGRSEMALEMPAGAGLMDVRKEISRQIPEISAHLDRCAFAVNQAYVKTNELLKDGDEVALIPPVSGG